MQLLYFRYFSTDIPIEQVQWLVQKNLPAQFCAVTLNSITLEDVLEKHLKISSDVDPSTLTNFSDSIKKISRFFKYPFFYNGLLAYLFFFYSDSTYQLVEPRR